MTVGTRLPKGLDGESLQGAYHVSGETHTVNIVGVSARSSAIGSDIVAVTPTVACFIQLGEAAVTADSDGHYLPANDRVHISMQGLNRIAAIGAVSGEIGKLYISEIK